MTTARDILNSAVADLLEGFAFLEAVPSPSGSVLNRDIRHMWSRIGIGEPFSGEIVLVMPVELVAQIAQNVFEKIPEADSGENDHKAIPELYADTLAELINTLAGQFLDKIVPESRSFSISLPESGSGITEPSPAEAFFFTADQFKFAVFVHLPENAVNAVSETAE